MKIFLVGQTKAGSNAFSKKMCEEHGLIPFSEEQIGIGEYNKSKMIWGKEDNFVMKVTGLSQHVIEMSKVGKVFWIDRRDRMALYASLKSFGQVAHWVGPFIDGFRHMFPDDELWRHYHWDDGWRILEKYVWMVQIKDYFKRKHFKDHCEELFLEDQDWYDETKMVSFINPLRDKGRAIVNATLEECKKCQILPQ